MGQDTVIKMYHQMRELIKRHWHWLIKRLQNCFHTFTGLGECHGSEEDGYLTRFSKRKMCFMNVNLFGQRPDNRLFITCGASVIY